MSAATQNQQAEWMLDGCVHSCFGAANHQGACEAAGLLGVIGVSTQQTFVYMMDDIMSVLMSHSEYLMPISLHL